MRRARVRTTTLADALARQHPALLAGTSADELVVQGRVLVAGRPVLNPAARVRLDEPVTVRTETALRGEPKLAGALDTFGLQVDGRVALDAGAAAGGFTSVLLARGVRRVYAVDAGHGQLRGALRIDPRVVTLERTNIGALDTRIVPEPIDLVTMDLSYLALGAALPQLDRVVIARPADLVALVKPMFELALPEPPTAPGALSAALDTARAGVAAAGWQVRADAESPVRGARGAVEFLLHARRG